MGKYAAALMRGNLLNSEALDRMFVPQLDVPGKPITVGNSAFQGLGWIVNEDSSRAWHTGAQQKAQCALVIYRNEGLAIAAMTNSSGVNTSVNVQFGSLTRAIRDLINTRLNNGESAIQTQLDSLRPSMTTLYYSARLFLSL